jgi:adenylylsulfate kinase-like enzyme
LHSDGPAILVTDALSPAGIDDPYEEPEAAELVLEAVDKAGQMVAPQVSAAKILEYLHAKRII